MEIKQADRIADSLEEMVFTGCFDQGERLVGVDLAEQRPRRGVFVKQPMSRRVIEMFETMAEIEAVCGRLAAERITGAEIDSLKSINEHCKAAIEDQDSDSYSRHNEAFHLSIYEMSGNGFLAQEAQRLYYRLRPFRRVQFRLAVRMSQSVAEHDALIGAMYDKDIKTVETVLRSHVGSQGRRFPKQMEKLRREAANNNA